MPLVISCDHCRREIKVSSRFAGREVACPHCKRRFQVPGEELASRPLPPVPAPPAATMTATVAPPVLAPPVLAPPSTWSETESRGDGGGEPELIHESLHEPLAPPVAAPPRRSDEPRAESRDTIVVTRTVILMQGALLGLMAMAGFVAGMLLARSYGTTPGRAAQPCFLTGKVLVQRGDAPLPDAGAVVLLFPQGERPDRGSKVSIAGLRPQDANPSAVGQSDQALRTFGADVCRVTEDGYFHLRVRDVGKYHVLVLSGRMLRDTSEALDRRMLAELGRYVDRANELIGPNAFQWREVDVRGDDQFNVTFR